MTLKMKWIYLVFVFLLMAVAMPAHAGPYVIGDEDVLSISVWGNPDLSVRVPVRPDGMISVPLVGDVKAAGITPQQLKTLLEGKYANYVKNPVVSVIMTDVNSFSIYVFGDGLWQSAVSSSGDSGSQSGVFTLKKNTTLLQLLCRLGNLGNADLKNGAIIRGGKRLSTDFYGLYIKGDVSQDIALMPGDFIYIPSGLASRIRVVGAVKTPGILSYTENMTVLDAVLSSGGFTDFASQNNVVIERKNGGKTESIKVKLKDIMDGDIKKNVFLKPGDMIIVKSRIF
ncbi:MAG: polysaccharide biosynthesis/export family protein [Nitrospiraceae bacterium]|nr:polysaccharide biosynthesis/export family protein [Nitrospiraceae bacterium]